MFPAVPSTATRGRVLSDIAEIASVVRALRVVAVLGIKTEAQRDQPAFFVPDYLVQAGLRVIPVPVYYPDVTQILGQRVYRRLSEIPEPVDLVDVFRRPEDLMSHMDDILAARPKVVWLQSGIRHAVFAERLVSAGIDVVEDRCLMVDHEQFAP